MRYWPVPSVTAVRTFSMRAGLVASTVTPGNIAPDASFTTPAITACAKARPGLITNKTTSATDFTVTRIFTSPLGWLDDDDDFLSSARACSLLY
jgi:hypothetical protein